MHPQLVLPRGNSRVGVFHIRDLRRGRQPNWDYWYILGVPPRVVMQNFLVGDRSYVGQRLEIDFRGLGRNNQLDNVQNLASIHWHFVDDRACKKNNK